MRPWANSRDEFAGPPPLFDRIDANKDGQITPDEVRQFRPGGAPAAKKEARKDKDGAK